MAHTPRRARRPAWAKTPWGTAVYRFQDYTPTQRLTWLLAFLQRDLAQMYPEEHTALGYDLVAVVIVGMMMGSGTKAPPVGYGRDLPPALRPPRLSLHTLRRCQTEIAQGLRAVLDDKPWSLPGTPTLLQDSPDNTYRLTIQPPPNKQADDTAVEWACIGSAHLLQEEGRLLRECNGVDSTGIAHGGAEGCGKLFVRTRRQTFCSLACSQRARNLRKKLRAAAEPVAAPATKKGRRR